MSCGSSQTTSQVGVADAAVPADVFLSIADAPPTADSRVTGDLASLDSAPASANRFPDTTVTLAILSDQLPNLNAQQAQFAATHYVGSQKLLLGAARALRAINPNFVVLHYHLAMWQSAPATSFITDGLTWGNDYPEVTTHETWFWHNASGARVPSSADGKLLMNVSNGEFAAYWRNGDRFRRKSRNGWRQRHRRNNRVGWCHQRKHAGNRRDTEHRWQRRDQRREQRRCWWSDGNGRRPRHWRNDGNRWRARQRWNDGNGRRPRQRRRQHLRNGRLYRW
jgi:hypothetical protein